MAGERILLVDDEPQVRRLLGAIVARGGHVGVEAATGREAVAAVEAGGIDAVLLDLGLPDRDGLEVLARLRALAAPPPVLVVSARDATAEKVAALDLGAEDYLTKPFDGDELLARLRAALRRRPGAPPAVVRAGDVAIDLDRRLVTRADVEVRLPPKEWALLAALAAHPGRVITHAQLLRDIWGPAHADDVEYLRVAARGLRLKLEAEPSRPRLLRNEPGIGYRLIVD